MDFATTGPEPTSTALVQNGIKNIMCPIRHWFQILAQDSSPKAYRIDIPQTRRQTAAVMLALRKRTSFLGRETNRVATRLDRFLSPNAGQTLRNRRLLQESFLSENIYANIRKQALDFFRVRQIGWHQGKECVSSVLSSQVAAVNFFFPFVNRPQELLAVLQNFIPDAAQFLPITADQQTNEEFCPCVTFEWMGRENYLNEPKWGQRGKNATSVDALFRFKTKDGRIKLLLVEWKYTESYLRAKIERFSKNGTDRLQLYGPLLNRPDSPVRPHFSWDELLVNPFYQLMRLQLLAREMEKAGEMMASSASVLMITPRANEELNTTITCKPLAENGKTIQEVWRTLVGEEKFCAIHTENLLESIVANTADHNWADYLTWRYGGMK